MAVAVTKSAFSGVSSTWRWKLDLVCRLPVNRVCVPLLLNRVLTIQDLHPRVNPPELLPLIHEENTSLLRGIFRAQGTPLSLEQFSRRLSVKIDNNTLAKPALILQKNNKLETQNTRLLSTCPGR
ncbi:hypothetical protein WN944_000526 [Citrus x changshan-huyou]|uniref:Uncharacterized protein n=1 Tax=Citrus x changshan-huyou TaxID=2935761 RepID=A0AAP0MHJ5_9ROSI